MTVRGSGASASKRVGPGVWGRARAGNTRTWSPRHAPSYRSITAITTWRCSSCSTGWGRPSLCGSERNCRAAAGAEHRTGTGPPDRARAGPGEQTGRGSTKTSNYRRNPKRDAGKHGTRARTHTPPLPRVSHRGCCGSRDAFYVFLCERSFIAHTHPSLLLPGVHCSAGNSLSTAAVSKLLLNLYRHFVFLKCST